jgi:hypothetical protein
VTSDVEQELDDRWWLGLRTRRLESVCAYEFATVLRFEEGSVLTVDTAATVRTATGVSATMAVLPPQEGTVSISDALVALTGQQVRSSVAFKTGALRIVFESGAVLTVPHGEKYEAWQLTGRSGRTWTSLPGGGLADDLATDAGGTPTG